MANVVIFTYIMLCIFVEKFVVVVVCITAEHLWITWQLYISHAVSFS